MVRTPSLGRIILALAIAATFLLQQRVEWHTGVWDSRLVPPVRCRQHTNPRRNRKRWLRRWVKWRRQRPTPKRRRRHRTEGVLIRSASVPPIWWLKEGSKRKPMAAPPPGKPPGEKSPSSPSPPELSDPLADLRARRGWIDQVSERELWEALIRVRWPHGPECPHCGERDPQYLRLIDANYRGGLGRWCCQVCAEAGDPGEGGTFTPLTGTILEGMRIDVRTLWLIAENFADGEASVETADEARVNRHTTDRLFRLLRAAIYQTRPT